MPKTLYQKTLIRNFLLISFAIIVMGAISLVLIYQYGTQRTFERNTRVADIVAKRLDTYMTFARERAEGTGKFLYGKTPKERAELLPQIFEMIKSFDMISLINRDYVIQDVYPRSSKYIGLDLSDRAYVRDIFGGKKLVQTGTFKSKAGDVVTLFAVALKDKNGQTDQVLTCVVNVRENQFFNKLMNQLKSEFGGYGYIVDGDRHIINHPDKDYFYKQIKTNEAINAVTQGKTGHLQLVNTKGRRMFAAYTPVKSVNWGIVVQEPISSVLTPMIDYIPMFLMAFIILVIFSLFIAHFNVKGLVQPIKELQSGMQLVSEGFLDKQVTVAGEDEIAYLTHTFNHMLTRLDILRQAEIKNYEELKNAEKLAAIGELAAGTAHEIRNPLTAIKGFIQMLERYDLSEEKRQEYLKIISEEICSIEKITGDFLILAKPRPEQFSNVDLEKVLQETINVIAHGAFVNRVSIVTKFSKIPKVFGDDGQLKQVFFNLFKNAIEAMPAGGYLRISTAFAADRGRVIVKIEDQGPGISEEIVGKLGQPFISTKENGTGLGLTVSYRIIQNHNGNIEVNSSSAGTVFIISLPQASKQKRSN